MKTKSTFKLPKTVKTKLHTYCVERHSRYAQEIDHIREITQGSGAGSPMICISSANKSFSGASYFPHTIEDVELNTKFLFENQWSEVSTDDKKGRQLFDYYEESPLSPGFRHRRYGHWLEITPEMALIRSNVYKCGYCGAQHLNFGKGFCEKCLGSEYLEEKNLFLLRLKPINECFSGKREKLNEVEKAWLIPAWKSEQGLGKARYEEDKGKGLRKKLNTLVSEAEKKAKALVENAKTEFKGKTWLLDNEYRDIDNVIFYDHSKKFCFGWRKKLSKEEKTELQNLLVAFPFSWEFHKDCAR